MKIAKISSRKNLDLQGTHKNKTQIIGVFFIFIGVRKFSLFSAWKFKLFDFMIQITLKVEIFAELIFAIYIFQMFPEN